MKSFLPKFVITLALLFIPVSHCHSDFLMLLHKKIELNRDRVEANEKLKLGLSLFDQGNILEATPLICNYFRIQQNNKFILKDLIKSSEEGTFFTYWQDNNRPFTEIIPNLAYQLQSDSLYAYAYDAALISKGFLLTTSVFYSQFKTITESKTFKDLKTNLHNQIDSIGDANKLKAEEDSLMKVLQTMPFSGVPLTTKWTDVKECLGDGDVAIEFIDISKKDNHRVYLALILRNTYETPKMVPLFEDNEITLSTTFPYVDESRGFKLIWEKIMPYLKDADNIFFSPTGVLHSLPIEYFPDEQDLPINWLFNMYRLSSTRELMISKSAPTGSLNCALFGGLDYSNEGTSGFSSQGTTRDIRYAIDEEILAYLPASRTEVENIASSLTQEGNSCQLFVGNNGDKSTFRNLSNSDVNIIHIATHGYYQPSHNDSITSVENELNNSGLIMSGGERLTAHDISQLNLSNSDLATLSACNTSSGQIMADNMQYGLQTAFKKAGVQAVLATLWPIDDEATSVFMTSFYKYYLADRRKFRSLRLAQQALCRSHGGKYNYSKYWGAFVLIDGIDQQSLSDNAKNKRMQYREDLDFNELFYWYSIQRTVDIDKRLAKPIKDGIPKFGPT